MNSADWLTAGIATIFSTVALRLACWTANRWLPREELFGAVLAESRESVEAQVYRTVDAGPFTAPGTSQLDLESPGPGESPTAVPIPTFWHALGIAAAGVIAFAVLMAGMSHVAPRVPVTMTIPFAALMISGALAAFTVPQYVLNVYFLPTTLARGLLVTVLQLVSLLVMFALLWTGAILAMRWVASM